jgi:subtilisin family serine protease
MFEEVVGEEDDFVRALEWADSIGVDIVTSSLGYYVWYEFADLDGNTAITTIACDIAVGKGITVCTAAGNERLSSWGHIIAPSDGDSVIAVGGVNQFGVLASFSSPGPSADGRFKPDVAARGLEVTTVNPNDSLGYSSSNGTSFSTPLVAGACALILQRNTGWGPMDVLDALRNEASQSNNPDNDLGWGIIDAHRSALYDPTAVINAIALDVTSSGPDVRGSVYNGNSSSQTVDVVRYKWRPEGNGYESSKNIETGVVLPGTSSVTFTDQLKTGGVYDYVVLMTADPLSQTTKVTVKYRYSILLGQNARKPFGTVRHQGRPGGHPGRRHQKPRRVHGRLERTQRSGHPRRNRRLFLPPSGPWTVADPQAGPHPALEVSPER